MHSRSPAMGKLNHYLASMTMVEGHNILPFLRDGERMLNYTTLMVRGEKWRRTHVV